MRKQWIIHIMILCGMTCNDPRTYSTVRVKHVIESVVWGHGANNQLFLSHFTDKLNVNVHLQTNVAICASVLNSKSVATVENVVYAFDEESLFKSSPNLPATTDQWQSFPQMAYDNLLKKTCVAGFVLYKHSVKKSAAMSAVLKALLFSTCYI